MKVCDKISEMVSYLKDSNCMQDHGTITEEMEELENDFVTGDVREFRIQNTSGTQLLCFGVWTNSHRFYSGAYSLDLEKTVVENDDCNIADHITLHMNKEI